MLFRDLAKRRDRLWPWLVTALVLAFTVLVERAEGRIVWCACGQPNLWVGDIWSAHCSQHLLMLLCPIDAVKQWQMVH